MLWNGRQWPGKTLPEMTGKGQQITEMRHSRALRLLTGNLGSTRCAQKPETSGVDYRSISGKFPSITGLSITGHAPCYYRANTMLLPSHSRAVSGLSPGYSHQAVSAGFFKKCWHPLYFLNVDIPVVRRRAMAGARRSLEFSLAGKLGRPGQVRKRESEQKRDE